MRNDASVQLSMAIRCSVLGGSAHSKVGLIIQKHCILVTVFATHLLPILLYACSFLCCSLVTDFVVFLITGYNSATVYTFLHVSGSNLKLFASIVLPTYDYLSIPTDSQPASYMLPAYKNSRHATPAQLRCVHRTAFLRATST